MTGHWYLSFASSFQFGNYLLWFLEERYRIDLDTVVLYTKIPLRPLIRIRVCNTLDTEVAYNFNILEEIEMGTVLNQ